MAANNFIRLAPIVTREMLTESSRMLRAFEALSLPERRALLRMVEVRALWKWLRAC